MIDPSMPAQSSPRATKVIVASTVMLSFISFWKAAAIVLCDLGSSAFYVGGIAEQAIGKAAPWFILGIMLFSYAVRAVYIESCSMFVRGGVYRVVHEAMGGTLAKFSVSALLFDYVLTGPISAVSAGLYLAGLLNETVDMLGHPGLRVPPGAFAVVFALAVTVYFWRKNTIGIHESSQKALRIMQLTTIMVVILIVWCLVTIALRGYHPVPLPTLGSLRFSGDSLGWLKGTGAPSILWIGLLIGFGHSLLAMSGEESLAQVNREIAYPKLKNLERAGFIIFVYSLLFTSLVSFFAVMLIPDQQRPGFIDNLIGGLAMNVAGPEPLRLLFHAFVVVVGTVILAGAVNTAIVGSNGVLNRVAEDGVLPDWLRHPHRKFGTTHRLINLIVGLQIVTILISRGDVYLLGEAYAFGVVWSFAMKALSVLVLRYKQPTGRQWKVPLNFKIGQTEIPVGLGLITLALFALAVINLLTKKVATISGFGFALTFFILFELSEKVNRRRHKGPTGEMEKFLVEEHEELAPAPASMRPGGVLVTVRNPHQLAHLKKVLEKTDTGKMDIAVVTVKQLSPSGSGEHDVRTAQVFTDDISMLFSRVVSLAEAAGKHVALIATAGVEPNETIAKTAQALRSSLIVMGSSAWQSVEEQAKAFGDAWERLPAPRPQMSLEIVNPQTGQSRYFNLGPHPPRLWPDDLDLLHRIWLELSEKGGGAKLHHRDVVRAALRRLEGDLRSDHGETLMKEILQQTSEDSQGAPPS